MDQIVKKTYRVVSVKQNYIMEFCDGGEITCGIQLVVVPCLIIYTLIGKRGNYLYIQIFCMFNRFLLFGNGWVIGFIVISECVIMRLLYLTINLLFFS